MTPGFGAVILATQSFSRTNLSGTIFSFSVIICSLTLPVGPFASPLRRHGFIVTSLSRQDETSFPRDPRRDRRNVMFGIHRCEQGGSRIEVSEALQCMQCRRAQLTFAAPMALDDVRRPHPFVRDRF